MGEGGSPHTQAGSTNLDTLHQALARACISPYALGHAAAVLVKTHTPQASNDRCEWGKWVCHRIRHTGAFHTSAPSPASSESVSLVALAWLWNECVRCISACCCGTGGVTKRSRLQCKSWARHNRQRSCTELRVVNSSYTQSHTSLEVEALG